MHITFRQLRVFLALAETGSVSAAARRMHVTQPTASMQLREITAAVGLPLYELVGKRVVLTDMGHRLAATARAMTHTWESFEQEVAACKGLTRGKLRLAVVSTAKYFMPRLVGAFCQQRPEVDVAMAILNRDGVLQRLREHLDDFYIMSMPPTDMDLVDTVLMANPIVVIAPSADPLAHAKQVALTDLTERRFILREPGSGTRMAADQHFRATRFTPDVRLELGSNEAVKQSVAAGLGLGVISRHALHGQPHDHGVSLIDVTGFPLPAVWHIVYPRSKQLSPLAMAFKAHVLATLAAPAQDPP